MLTGVVSVLHMVFDMLAFKNDIKFWRNQKSLEGLSVGTVFINCFCSVSKTRSATLFRVMGESDIAVSYLPQVVIFLYLCNSEEIRCVPNEAYRSQDRLPLSLTMERTVG
eukprot:COSAG04_NODE_5949_length_1448_cov_16.379540_2_plen_110_part_00